MKRCFYVLLLCTYIVLSACVFDKAEAEVSDAGEALEVTTGPVLLKNGWVYFTSGTEPTILYRMRPDGTDLKALSEVTLHSPFLTLADDWIYYNSADPRNKISGLFCKISINGNEKIKILKDRGDFTHTFQVYGEWIYYTHEYLAGLYKVSIDGTEYARISDLNAGCFWIHEDWLYFTLKAPDLDTLPEPKLFRMHLDGSRLTKLSNHYPGKLFFIGEWIYYYYDSQGWRMKTDGTEKSELLSDSRMTKLLQVSDDRIIFTSEGDFYSADLDGSNREKLNIRSNLGSDFKIAGDWIYYNNSGLNKVKLVGTGDTKLNDERLSRFYIVDDWIYYYRSPLNDSCDPRLCRMKPDGSQAGPIVW